MDPRHIQFLFAVSREPPLFSPISGNRILVVIYLFFFWRWLSLIISTKCKMLNCLLGSRRILRSKKKIKKKRGLVSLDCPAIILSSIFFSFFVGINASLNLCSPFVKIFTERCWSEKYFKAEIDVLHEFHQELAFTPDPDLLINLYMTWILQEKQCTRYKLCKFFCILTEYQWLIQKSPRHCKLKVWELS